jgi:ribose/xylose/arabinose/galactoside ABC-type transport system permease subunit
MTELKAINTFSKRLVAWLTNNVVIAIALLAFVLISIFVPNFFTLRNIKNVLVQSAILCILAAGIAPILILGGIDLSLASTMGLSSILGALYMIGTGNVFLGIIIMLVSGVLIGLFNGFCISRLGMVPFIVTMSVMIVNTGVSTWIARAGSLGGFPRLFLRINKMQLGFLQFPIFLTIVIFIAAFFIMNRSYIGRMLYATGVNETAAKICGIKTKRFILFSYALGGFFAAVAGIIMTSRMGVAAPSLARESVVLDYISAAVIGGVSIYGGKGTVNGAIIGAIFITAINNSLNLLGVDYQTILIVKGLILIIIVGMEKVKINLPTETNPKTNKND